MADPVTVEGDTTRPTYFDSGQGFFLVQHQARSADLRLPVPSPHTYFDNYHHPRFPEVFPAIHSFFGHGGVAFGFPRPIGHLEANRYDVLGVPFHDFSYVNRNPQRCFTKYMLWYLEVNDHLIRSICPSDLNDMPCEWDELQGGCPLLRLCYTKEKFPHPHLGQLPSCSFGSQHNCRYIHNIDRSCRSIGKQFLLPEEKQFCSHQLCEFVSRGELCDWGHDFERARAESVHEYWRHRAAARAHGSVGVIRRDVWGRRIAWKPPGSLAQHHAQVSENEPGV